MLALEKGRKLKKLGKAFEEWTRTANKLIPDIYSLPHWKKTSAVTIVTATHFAVTVMYSSSGLLIVQSSIFCFPPC